MLGPGRTVRPGSRGDVVSGRLLRFICTTALATVVVGATPALAVPVGLHPVPFPQPGPAASPAPTGPATPAGPTGSASPGDTGPGDAARTRARPHPGWPTRLRARPPSCPRSPYPGRGHPDPAPDPLPAVRAGRADLPRHHGGAQAPGGQGEERRRRSGEGADGARPEPERRRPAGTRAVPGADRAVPLPGSDAGRQPPAGSRRGPPDPAGVGRSDGQGPRLKKAEAHAGALDTASRAALQKKKALVARQKQQYRTAQARLREAEALLAGLSPGEVSDVQAQDDADTTAAQGALDASGALSGPQASASRRGTRAVAFGLAQVGKPYLWGAEGPRSFDCSGLTWPAWAHAGRTIPRTSQEQWRRLPRVSLRSATPGRPGRLLPGGHPCRAVHRRRQGRPGAAHRGQP